MGLTARSTVGGIRARLVRAGLHSQSTRNLLIQFGDLAVVDLQQAQVAPEQEAVMLPQGPLHRLRQLVALVAQASACQLSQCFGILLPVEQGLQDGAPRHPGDIGRH